MSDQWEIEVRNSLRTLTTQVGQLQKGLSSNADQAKRMKDELRGAAEQAKAAATAQRGLAETQRRGSMAYQSQVQQAAFAAQQHGARASATTESRFTSQKVGNFASLAGAQVPGMGGALGLIGMGTAGIAAAGVGAVIATVVQAVQEAAEMALERAQRTTDRESALKTGREAGASARQASGIGIVRSKSADLRLLGSMGIKSSHIDTISRDNNSTTDEVISSLAILKRTDNAERADQNTAIFAAKALQDSGLVGSLDEGMHAVLALGPGQIKKGANPLVIAARASRIPGMNKQRLGGMLTEQTRSDLSTTVNGVAKVDAAASRFRLKNINAAAEAADDNFTKTIQENDPDLSAKINEGKTLIEQQKNAVEPDSIKGLFRDGLGVFTGDPTSLQVLQEINNSLGKNTQASELLLEQLKRQNTAPIGQRR